mmetsp:Transcript_97567/g.168249  ORF Transcript_97567/g.168249 Transcript_97567/m.168249 type:complete len:371 (+) Transcript_97567:1630-2742(+)
MILGVGLEQRLGVAPGAKGAIDEDASQMGPQSFQRFIHQDGHVWRTEWEALVGERLEIVIQPCAVAHADAAVGVCTVVLCVAELRGHRRSHEAHQVIYLGHDAGDLLCYVVRPPAPDLHVLQGLPQVLVAPPLGDDGGVVARLGTSAPVGLRRRNLLPVPVPLVGKVQPQQLHHLQGGDPAVVPAPSKGVVHGRPTVDVRAVPRAPLHQLVLQLLQPLAGCQVHGCLAMGPTHIVDLGSGGQENLQDPHVVIGEVVAPGDGFVERRPAALVDGVHVRLVVHQQLYHCHVAPPRCMVNRGLLALGRQVHGVALPEQVPDVIGVTFGAGDVQGEVGPVMEEARVIDRTLARDVPPVAVSLQSTVVHGAWGRE